MLKQCTTTRRCFTLGTSDSTISKLLGTPPRSPPETVTAVGWIRTVRKQKRVTFLELGDGSTPRSLQAVLKPSQSNNLSTGAAVSIKGTWQSTPSGTEQTSELQADEVKIYGPCDESFPIQKKYHSPEYLRTIPHLRLRTPFNAVLARLRSEIDYALTSFFREREFVRVQPPIITSSDCEGAGEVFQIKGDQPVQNDSAAVDQSDKFFKSQKYLTVSSQLHLEAFVHEHPRVWTLSPTFRAEKSDTPRHLSEFSMLEAELRTESLDEVIDLVEQMLQEVVSSLQQTTMLDDLLFAQRKALSGEGDEQQAKQQANLSARWRSLTSTNWPRMTYEEALSELKKAYSATHGIFVHEPSLEGLQLEHEKWLVNSFGRRQPIFITHYPQHAKPFYMLPNAGVDSGIGIGPTAMCFDLLFPEVCEVVGGSLREHRLAPLIQSMRARGMAEDSSASKATLDWYLDLRRYGSVPHGGFGLGFDRFLSYLSGVSNIKDVVQWPRYSGRCDC